MSVSPPSFRFSGLYYPEILQDLILWMRVNVPEITDEDPNELAIQFLRAYALVGHLNNVLLDHVARETLLPTARLRESVKAHLKLIDYDLSQPTPSVADLIWELGTVPITSTSLGANLRFSTSKSETQPEISFETGDAVSFGPGDVVGYLYTYDIGTDEWYDFTEEANGNGEYFYPWVSTPQAGDLIYIGHDNLLWNDVVITHSVVGDIFDFDDHVWEYYDGQLDTTNPTEVEIVGPNLEFDLTSLLGDRDRHGSEVVVRCTLTGQYAAVTSEWSGTHNYCETDHLGQSSPSEDITNYLVGTEWKEPDDLRVDASDSDHIEWSFTLPETTTRKWQKTTINGANAYWLRIRMINDTSTAPFWDRIKIDDGTQYYKTTVTQGQSIIDDPAGSSSGLANQTFTTSRDDVIEASLDTYVDEGSGKVLWAVADDFLSAGPTSRVYTLDYDNDGRGTITFGDGTLGKIPPAGTDNISFEYRIGAKTDGNVGADTITEKRTGAAIIASVTNPRAAVGWYEAEGSSPEGLEIAKDAGPATLRTLNRALTIEDVETLVSRFVAEDGTSPVARSLGIEDGYGVKTVQLIVVGTGGGAIPDSTLEEIDLYFNGNVATDQPGILVLNTELTTDNFTPRPVTIDATVTGGSEPKIVSALLQYLHPLAQTGDEYIHDFGGIIYRSRIISEIFSADPDVENVVLTTPSADIELDTIELPTSSIYSINITVV